MSNSTNSESESVKKVVDLLTRETYAGRRPPEPPEMPPADYVTHKEFQEVRAEINERFARVETRLDQTASKADLADLRSDMHEGFSTMIKWVVGSAIGLGAAGITVMTFVLNNATPKAPSAQQQAPIIINVPAPSTAPLSLKDK